MCGRFGSFVPMEELAAHFGLIDTPERKPRYNIAPTQYAAVVRRTDKDRELAFLKWGLVPFWAKDASGGARMINARLESVADKPAFRAAAKRRRCLVATDGFYEWAKTGKGKKSPWFINLKDDRTFAFAGLWETWEDQEASGEILESFAIITCRANELMSGIHDRMPVILNPDDYDLWLDTAVDDFRVVEPLCGPFDSGAMKAVEVGSYVGNIRNEGPECIRPVEQAQPGLFD